MPDSYTLHGGGGSRERQRMWLFAALASPRRSPHGFLLGCVAVANLLVCTASAEVTCRHEDLDGDGVAEVILENRFLRVEILTGELPAETVETGNQDETATAGRAPKPRYGTRFVWAGWIWNITFKPTNQRWFVNDEEHQWHGIPEEFEEAVRVRETEPGVYEALKVGIGVCSGTGICHSSRLQLTRPGAWERREVVLPDGRRGVLFEQAVSTGTGHGYRYVKKITLQSGSSSLVVERTLENTGMEPLHTTWFTHAFWGQAPGDTYDDASWCTIPMRQQGLGRTAIDTRRCMLSPARPFGVWGSIESASLGGSWYACGQVDTRDLMLTTVSEPLAFFRVWTYRSTYSCEPFMTLDLAPGQARSWTVVRGSGTGMAGLRGGTGEALVDWELLPADGAGDCRLQLEVITTRPRKDLVVETIFSGSAEPSVSLMFPVSVCGPEQVWSVVVPVPHVAKEADLRVVVKQEVKGASGEVLADVTRRCSMASRLAAEVPLPPNARNSLLVLSDLGEDQRNGKPAMLRGAVYARDAMVSAGWAVEVADPARIAGPEAGWEAHSAVIAAGLTRWPKWLVGWLEKHVEQGGGFVFFGPLVGRPFEFSPLLPIQRVLSSVSVTGWRPRDATREFIGATARRYHLVPAQPHVVLEGQPWHPSVPQDIAVLQTMEPRKGSTVLLRYVSGADVVPKVGSPALVVGSHGGGRVAVFASPVDWGSPPSWVVYSRVGEYHHRFISRLVQWSAGKLH